MSTTQDAEYRNSVIAKLKEYVRQNGETYVMESLRGGVIPSSGTTFEQACAVLQFSQLSVLRRIDEWISQVQS